MRVRPWRTGVLRRLAQHLPALAPEAITPEALSAVYVPGDAGAEEPRPHHGQRAERGGAAAVGAPG